MLGSLLLKHIEVSIPLYISLMVLVKLTLSHIVSLHERLFIEDTIVFLHLVLGRRLRHLIISRARSH